MTTLEEEPQRKAAASRFAVRNLSTAAFCVLTLLQSHQQSTAEPAWPAATRTTYVNAKAGREVRRLTPATTRSVSKKTLGRAATSKRVKTADQAASLQLVSLPPGRSEKDRETAHLIFSKRERTLASRLLELRVSNGLLVEHSPAPLASLLSLDGGGDYNGDGFIDFRDYSLWRWQAGSAVVAESDAFPQASY